MLRKALLGLAPAVALVAIAVGSQTSSAALAVDEVNLVSQNAEFAKPKPSGAAGTGMGSGLRGGLHKGMGRPRTGIKTSIKGIKTGPVHVAGVS